MEAMDPHSNTTRVSMYAEGSPATRHIGDLRVHHRLAAASAAAQLRPLGQPTFWSNHRAATRPLPTSSRAICRIVDSCFALLTYGFLRDLEKSYYSSSRPRAKS